MLVNTAFREPERKDALRDQYGKSMEHPSLRSLLTCCVCNSHLVKKFLTDTMQEIRKEVLIFEI